MVITWDADDHIAQTDIDLLAGDTCANADH